MSWVICSALLNGPDGNACQVHTAHHSATSLQVAVHRNCDAENPSGVLLGMPVAKTKAPKRRTHHPPALPVPKLAFNIAETCAALGISRPTFYAMVERGELHPVRAGRRVFIPLRDLERLLERPNR